MMEKKDILFGLTGLLFALSAVFMVISQNYSDDATNSLIDSIIKYETSGYLSYMELMNLNLLNSNSIDKNTELSMRNLICSFAEAYKDSSNPDIVILQQAYSQCMNLSIDDLIEERSRLINQSYQLQNLSDALSPFKGVRDNFENFKKFKRYSNYWQIAGLITFILGFFVFYYCLLEYFMKKALRQKELNGGTEK